MGFLLLRDNHLELTLCFQQASSMSQKRQQEDGKTQSEGNGSDDKRRRVPSLRNVFLEAMKMHSIQHILEPLVRKVVKEEVDLALRKHLTSMKRNYEKVVQASESRSLQLHFLNNLSLPVFTGTKIEGEDCSTMKVALVDALTNQIVNTGPESSSKVEIVVLEGDFDGEEADNWTIEEFRNNIVKEREGKKPLLSGDVFLNFKEGIGLIGEISFSDNSSWTRSRKFRLGARVVDNDEVRVREAKSESFIVRDHRGELYKKHHPPSLLDEVWRLEKIGKDGAFHKRLNRENVHTVKDFLTLLCIDPPRLRNILGSGMSAKMWEITVDHARTCIVDKRLYLYCPPGSHQKTGVVFNVVGQVMGILLECQYVPLDKLSEPEKADAYNLVVSAFEHWDEVVSFDDEKSLAGTSSHSPSRPCTSSSSMADGPYVTSKPLPSPDVVPSFFSIGGGSNLDDFALQGFENMDLRYDQPSSFVAQISNSIICDTESMAQAFYDDEHLSFFDSDCTLPSQGSSLGSQADLHSAVSSFLLARPAPVAIAQRRWRMLFNVLKWFSVRRKVALKRTQSRRYT